MCKKSKISTIFFNIKIKHILVTLIFFCLINLCISSSGAVHWTNPAGGNWNTPGNWSTGIVPGLSDVALIDCPGTYTIILNTNATITGFSLGETTGTQTLFMNSNTLSFDGASTITKSGVLNLDGGTLTGTGSLLSYGILNWTHGSISGVGSLTIDEYAIMNISGSDIKGQLAQRTINNFGTINWNAGNIDLSYGAIINNQPGAIFDIKGDVSFVFADGATTINNMGTLRKSAGTGTTSFEGIVFNNTGLVQIQSGKLNVGGGSSSGEFNVSLGGEFNFSLGGTHTFKNGAVLAGQGFIGGWNTTLSVDTNSTATVVGKLELFTGTLTGPGILNVPGIFTWNGGAISGAGVIKISESGAMNISGLGLKGQFAQRTINNLGTINWNAGNIDLHYGGIINNYTGATFDIKSDVSFVFADGATTINNMGIFKKSGGTGASQLEGISFNNTGVLDVLSGTLYIPTLTNFSGTTLSGGTYLVESILKFNNANVVTNSAMVVLDGPASQIINHNNGNGLINFANNTLNGSFTIKNGRHLTTAGGFANAGIIAIDNSSTFSLANSYTQTSGLTRLTSSTLTAGDTVYIQGGDLFGIGIIDANVLNTNGNINPGLSPGRLAITEEYEQGQTGVLNIEIGGYLQCTENDIFEISKNAIFDGILNVNFINGFIPNIGDSFEIVLYDSRNWGFKSVNVSGLGEGLFYELHYTPKSLLLVIRETPPKENRWLTH